MIETASLDSPLGTLLLEVDSSRVQKGTARGASQALAEKIPKTLPKAAHQMDEYFKGNHNNFNSKNIPNRTVFQQRNRNSFSIRLFGKTSTYMNLAEAPVEPKTILNATNAHGKNPVMVIIPGHRVIRSERDLTGCAGGLWCKTRLLEQKLPAIRQKQFLA